MGQRVEKPIIRHFIINPYIDLRSLEESGSNRLVLGDHRGKWWKFPWSRGHRYDARSKVLVPLAKAVGANSVLKLKDKIRMRPEKFGGLIFDPPVYYEINQSAYEILRKLQISATLNEIKDFSKHRLELEPCDVDEFLEKLWMFGILETR